MRLKEKTVGDLFKTKAILTDRITVNIFRRYESFGIK